MDAGGLARRFIVTGSAGSEGLLAGDAVDGFPDAPGCIRRPRECVRDAEDDVADATGYVPKVVRDVGQIAGPCIAVGARLVAAEQQVQCMRVNRVAARQRDEDGVFDLRNCALQRRNYNERMRAHA